MIPISTYIPRTAIFNIDALFTYDTTANMNPSISRIVCNLLKKAETLFKNIAFVYSLEPLSRGSIGIE